VVCLAPRALKDSVRPRGLSGVGARPLNFTVRRRVNFARISAVVVLEHQTLTCNP
jgi:hypothetical protein